MKYSEVCPKTFNAGYTQYKIVFEKNLLCSGEGLYGHVNFQEETITIDDSIEGSVARSTIIHECMHVMLDTLGLGAPEEENNLTVTNEVVTESTTRAMMMFHSLNLELWNILFPSTIIFTPDPVPNDLHI